MAAKRSKKRVRIFLGLDVLQSILLLLEGEAHSAEELEHYPNCKRCRAAKDISVAVERVSKPKQRG